MIKKYILFIVTILFLAINISSLTAEDDVVTVTLKSDQTLRSLAIKYFGEPNDWEVILFYNGFQSPGEVNIGTKLKIPVQLYKKINKQLKDAQKLISQANNEGAGILAKDLVESAISAQKEAIGFKKKGQLDLAYEKATESVNFARNAIQQTKDKRIKSISAILSEKKGKVQSRKQAQTIWYDANKKQELIEKERIRTLSSASGEISFVDGSKLDLSENSLAVIEAMKQDLIKNTNTSSVVVLQGDIMAYLSSQNKKNQVNVSAPGVETDIRSRSFRASRDENNVTKFANYDGEIDIKAAGGSVTLNKNEGTSINPGEKPKAARKLLPSPTIISPEPKAKIFTNVLNIKWNQVPLARSYKIQISTKRSFSELLLNQDVKGKAHYNWNSNSTGVFYLQIASIDNENFTGPFSSTVKFYIDKDITPPYLLVETPKDDESVYQDRISITGVAELSALLMINTDSVAVDPQGRFSHSVKLISGKNDILIHAEDLAGNISEVKKTVFYNADDKLIYLDGNTTITTNSQEHAITGSTKPGTEITINGQPINLVDYKFNHIVSLRKGSNQVTINAKSQKGNTQSLTVTIIVDLDPPDISLGDIPSFTNEVTFDLSGYVSEKCNLIVNNRNITVTQNRFVYSIDLAEGDNFFEMIAEDEAGNQTLTEVEIFRDTEKPQIRSVTIFPEQVKGGELGQIKVVARDDGVGLARNGKYIIELNTGTQTFSGMLSLSSKGTYMGNLVIPPGISGKLRFRELNIQDYLGNQADYP
ncbi:MAG: FecR family protein [Candidatus Marinimicrobia bacterium]|nr:FecR family protein [Candidatus Neomarinimicrobiota bacterium]